MNIICKFTPAGGMVVPNGVDADGDDTIVQCSTGRSDRDDEIIIQAGIDFSGYMSKNPMVLWQHLRDAPIARMASLWMNSAGLVGRIKWPPLGISAKSDEVRGLVKAGIVNAISIGFKPIEMVPINPKNPRGPKKYLRSELLEVSWVTLPSNPDAIVIQRSANLADMAAREKRMRDFDLLSVPPIPPMTRSERMAVAREMDADFLRRTS